MSVEIRDVAQSSDDELSLTDVLEFVVRHWLRIGLGALIGGSFGLAAALLMTPVYRAQALIVPVESDRSTSVVASLAGQLGSLAGLAGDLGLGGRTSTDVSIATLRSREVMRAFITKYDLLPVLFAARWDAKAKTWKDDNESPPTMDDALLVLERQILAIAEDRRRGLVTVAVEWQDRDAAARWANDLVALTNETVRARIIDENERNVAFLEEELKRTNVVERQQIIYRLIESRVGEIMLANGRREYAFAVVDPATPPDENKFVRPKRLMMVVLGTMAGGTLGLILVALTAAFKRWRGRSGHAA